jgi:hypothetical protein
MENKLFEWMINFVEQPNELLGGWSPCPFARKARLTDKIKIQYSEATRLLDSVFSNLDLLDQYEVVVIWFDHTQITPHDLGHQVIQLNTELLKQNYVVLEDHPDNVEIINGVRMNFGHAGLLVVQRLDKLQQAAEMLKSKGYYSCWSEAELDSVVTWRNTAE